MTNRNPANETVQISVKIPSTLFFTAKQYNINMTQAAIFGIRCARDMCREITLFDENRKKVIR